MNFKFNIVALYFSFLSLTSFGFELKFNESKKESQQTVQHKITVAFVGDILVHKNLYLKVINSKKNDFSILWKKTEPLIQKADFTYGNLEGPAALGINNKKIDIGDIGFKYDDSVYSGTNLLFNYHPQIISDLVLSGFDIVSTANNHSMDRGSIGIDKTIDALNDRKLNYFGTKKADKEKKSLEPWYKITEINNIKIAWISCTEALNGFIDKHNQVLMCYDNAEEIQNDIKKIKSEGLADLVFVMPHWGIEYKHTPNDNQKKHAYLFAEAGADAIIGSHPHVLQPVEKYVTKDQREVFIVYSLGNFLADQKQFDRKVSAIVYLEFFKSTAEKTKSLTWINSYTYQPIFREKAEIIPAADKPDVIKHVEKYLGQFKQ